MIQVTLLALREVQKHMHIGIYESEARELIHSALSAAGLDNGHALVLFGGTFSFLTAFSGLHTGLYVGQRTLPFRTAVEPIGNWERRTWRYLILRHLYMNIMLTLRG